MTKKTIHVSLKRDPRTGLWHIDPEATAARVKAAKAEHNKCRQAMHADPEMFGSRTQDVTTKTIHVSLRRDPRTRLWSIDLEATAARVKVAKAELLNRCDGGF